MYEARTETLKTRKDITLYLDFLEFPQVKNLKLDDKGSVILFATLIRELSEEGKIEKWIRINAVKIIKEKRLQ